MTKILSGYNPRVSVEVYKKLKQCGKDVRLYLLEGADHGGSEFWTEEIQNIIIQFMNEALTHSFESYL